MLLESNDCCINSSCQRPRDSYATICGEDEPGASQNLQTSGLTKRNFSAIQRWLDEDQSGFRFSQSVDHDFEVNFSISTKQHPLATEI